MASLSIDLCQRSPAELTEAWSGATISAASPPTNDYLERAERRGPIHHGSSQRNSIDLDQASQLPRDTRLSVSTPIELAMSSCGQILACHVYPCCADVPHSARSLRRRLADPHADGRLTMTMLHPICLRRFWEADIVSAGDVVADGEAEQRLTSAYDTKHSIRFERDRKPAIVLGADVFPFQ